MKQIKLEKGQILVILAVAMVALLGFTALAIDGSMVYNARRQNQSTADSAALGGAGAAAQYLKIHMTSGFSCGTTLSANASNVAVTSAQTTASEDGVSLLGYDISTNNGVETTCGTSNGVPYIDIHTVVSTSVHTTFLKVITNQPINTVVEAIARVYINTAFAGGNAIYTTGTTCSETNTGGGIFSSGGQTNVINITGGGIYSSSCLSVSGSARILANNGVMQYYGKGTTTFYTGSQIQYTVGNGLLFSTNSNDFILNDPDTTTGPSIASALSQSYQLWSSYTANPAIDPSLWPVPTAQTYPHLMQAMTVPSCTGLTAQSVPSHSSTTTLYPGIYSSISWNGWGGGEKLVFTPGTYCVSGSINLAGGSDTITMDKTVIYFTGTSGSGITYGGSNTYSQNKSTIYITNGDFNLGAGVPLNANYITVYIKQGNFLVSGSASGLMNAPGCNTSACGVGPSIPGVLIYMADTNTGYVSIEGSGTMTMTGTVYAPNSGVHVTGDAGALTLNVQIIARMVTVKGSSSINMNQGDATLYSQGSTTIELLK